MIVSLYAIYDSASGVYDGPFPGTADGAVSRNFSDMCLNADHPIGKHPDCYTLFRVGSWNDGTGEVADIDPLKLMNGVEAVAAARTVNGAQMTIFDPKGPNGTLPLDG